MDILTLDEVAELLKLKRSSAYELTHERSQKAKITHYRLCGSQANCVSVAVILNDGCKGWPVKKRLHELP